MVAHSVHKHTYPYIVFPHNVYCYKRENKLKQREFTAASVGSATTNTHSAAKIHFHISGSADSHGNYICVSGANSMWVRSKNFSY